MYVLVKQTKYSPQLWTEFFIPETTIISVYDCVSSGDSENGIETSGKRKDSQSLEREEYDAVSVEQNGRNTPFYGKRSDPGKQEIHKAGHLVRDSVHFGVDVKGILRRPGIRRYKRLKKFRIFSGKFRVNSDNGNNFQFSAAFFAA